MKKVVDALKKIQAGQQMNAEIKALKDSNQVYDRTGNLASQIAERESQIRARYPNAADNLAEAINGKRVPLAATSTPMPVTKPNGPLVNPIQDPAMGMSRGKGLIGRVVAENQNSAFDNLKAKYRGNV